MSDVGRAEMRGVSGTGPNRLAPLNRAEFARFVLSGLVATLGNMAAMHVARAELAYEFALLVGFVAGLSISFALTKLFAFRSRSWARAPGEAVRFLMVYLSGFAAYWTTAVLSNRLGLLITLRPVVTENIGILVGGGVMMIVTYFGHRFFTYHTSRQAARL